MKKILLLSEIFPPAKGGSGRWFWEVYTRMQPGEVVAVAGESKAAETFDKSNPIKTFRLALSSTCWGVKSVTGFLFYWRVYWAARKIIKQEHIEVVHCGRCIPEGFIGFLLNKTLDIPYICYIHGEDVETATASRELTLIVKAALKTAEFLVCNCQNTASILLESWGTSPEKTKVINPGVDATQFVPEEFNPQVRSLLAWDKRKVILTVGRLQKRKGHDMMIRALPAVKKLIPDVLYAIIGEGSQRCVLEELVEELDLTSNVLFMSEITDKQMIQAYQQCDIFILPNRTVGRDIEGFGMVLVEAQACGKPVVAGDSGGTAETMLVGESGFIIDCTSASAIADTLTPLLLDKCRADSIGKIGREHAVLNLDWHELSQKAKKLFEQM